MSEDNLNAYSEIALASLTLPNVIYPILDKMEKDEAINNVGKQQLKNAFTKIDSLYPNVVYELINELIRVYNKQQQINNLNEIILRLEKYTINDDYLLIKKPEFKELNQRAKHLKLILSKIPDEINDRKAFLETIKEIAAAIKKKLDAVNQVFDIMQSQDVKQILDIRKREFVKYSKLFSNTLKQYFRQGQSDDVFCAANCLISQTNLILKTLKLYCEAGTLN